MTIKKNSAHAQIINASQIALPQFSDLDLAAFPKRLETLLDNNLQHIEVLLQQKHFDWNGLINPLESMGDAIEHLWSPLSHLHAVVNSKELRLCYQACLPKLSAYESALGQNSALYEAIKAIPHANLNATQQKIITDMLQDFELSGVALSKSDKERFEAIQARLSELSNQFDNQVLDATQAYTLAITDKTRLRGLPEHALHAAQELALEKKQKGFMLTLEYPCYLAVITYAEDRELREQLYYAFVTRASDQGPNANQFDNSANIDEILALRHEKAQLLGYTNYAELSLATKMAESTEEVVGFLTDLLKRSYSQAQAEFEALKQFAANQFNLKEIEPWDLAFLSEKMRQANFSLSQEELRPYFPEDTLMQGLFTIVERLYGVRFQEIADVDIWHKDVKCYQLLDANDKTRGYLYMDLFARPNKRGGAWMDTQQGRRCLPDDTIQLPIATLTCNFAKPTGNAIATFSHDEVTTLFHELGHCLQHLLTKVDYLSAAGINGVEWDAVELPSQFFENWCWEKEALALLTRHTKTNEALPEILYERLLASKNFQSALAMIRQLEFSLFDFKLHRDYAKTANYVATLLSAVQQDTRILPRTAYNRFQNSFSHIFAGGYAAGYYSYKWAEVLSSDAYSRFEEEGIFNPQTGRDFLQTVLEVGGSKEASEAFVAFRGRPANIDALLRHSGIIPS